MRKTWLTTTAAVLVLAGCAANGGSSGGTASDGGTASGGGTAAGGTPAASSSVLSTWASPLGTVVVTAEGRAVYVFDKDTPGAKTSACTGVCANLWHAVTATSSAPSVTGVQGSVGTLPTADGKRQVALDGHRLYTYAGDSASGQITGEGVMNIWWLVSPTGTEVKQASSSSPAYAGY